MPTLIGCTTDELRELVVAMNLPAYRGSQLGKQIYRHQVDAFEKMLELPEDLRIQLASRFTLSPLVISRHQTSSDGVQKFLVHSGDGEGFECVLLPFENRVSCCISTQIGCPMGCRFCATGLGGFDRNLSAGEIVAQYLLLQRNSEKRISHVVFMGMGEPLLNLPNVLKTIQILTKEIGLSARSITVSTVGIAPQIVELADANLSINLALSLHSPFDDVRSRLMPVNNRWKISEVMDAMKTYFEKTKRKLTIEYLLIHEVNDRPEDARELARLMKGLCGVVNLIPFNFVDTGEGFRRPERERIKEFRSILENSGIECTQRAERGHDIDAACGQLAGRHHGKFAKRSSLSALPSAH